MVKTWARLVRLPNLFTAMADPVAGVMLGFLSRVEHSGDPDWFSVAGWRIPALMGISAFLYAAGILWNDVADRERDRQQRPERPLPSGQVSVKATVMTGSVLGLLGAGAAWWIAWPTGMLAGCLLLTILAYDFLLKRYWLGGAIGMAMCRALNVTIGVFAVLPVPQSMEVQWWVLTGSVWIPPVILYSAMILAITAISCFEEQYPVEAESVPDVEKDAPSAAAPVTLFVGWAIVLLSLSSWPVWKMGGMWSWLSPLLAVLAVAWGGKALIGFIRLSVRPRLGLVIRNAILSIPLVWAGFVAGWSGPEMTQAHGMAALLLLSLYVPLFGSAAWLKTKDA